MNNIEDKTNQSIKSTNKKVFQSNKKTLEFIIFYVKLFLIDSRHRFNNQDLYFFPLKIFSTVYLLHHCVNNDIRPGPADSGTTMDDNRASVLRIGGHGLSDEGKDGKGGLRGPMVRPT